MSQVEKEIIMKILTHKPFMINGWEFNDHVKNKEWFKDFGNHLRYRFDCGYAVHVMWK